MHDLGARRIKYVGGVVGVVGLMRLRARDIPRSRGTRSTELTVLVLLGQLLLAPFRAGNPLRPRISLSLAPSVLRRVCDTFDPKCSNLQVLHPPRSQPVVLHDTHWVTTSIRSHGPLVITRVRFGCPGASGLPTDRCERERMRRKCSLVVLTRRRPRRQVLRGNSDSMKDHLSRSTQNSACRRTLPTRWRYATTNATAQSSASPRSPRK